MKTARLLGVLAACVLVGASASGRDLTTVTGTVYKNITVTKMAATGVEISHDDGIIFLDYRNFNEADRKELGFDAKVYVEGMKINAELDKQKRAQMIAAQQAAAAKAKAQAADATAWKTYDLDGPSSPTIIEYSVGTPGYGYGPYYYPGRFFPTVPQTYYGNGSNIPYMRSPYYHNGAAWGPTIIRQR